MYRNTVQLPWQVLARATDQANVSTYPIAYNAIATAAWTAASTAQNPANRPTAAFAVPQGEAWNHAQIMFLLNQAAADTVDDDTAAYELWGWAADTSPGLKLCTGVLTAGAIPLGTVALNTAGYIKCPDPTESMDDSGQWAYVDTITVANKYHTRIINEASGYTGCIATLTIDLIGLKYVWAQFKCDGGGGVTTTDAMALIRGY